LFPVLSVYDCDEVIMAYIIKDCTEEQLPEIMAIFNDVIVNSTALYEYKPRTASSMQSWYAAKRKGNYPIIGAFDNNGVLLGFASFGSFRDYPAFKYTVEHSIYIKSDARRQGLGKILLKKIIENAEAQGYHILVAAIDKLNMQSIKFHERAGFIYCGEIKESGYKFGKWLDLVFYELILKTPI